MIGSFIPSFILSPTFLPSFLLSSDGAIWVERLKEEYQALIKYVTVNKEADNDWFRLESNKEGTRWFGKCWHIENMLKYEFEIEFDIPGDFLTGGGMGKGGGCVGVEVGLGEICTILTCRSNSVRRLQQF